MIIRRIHFFLLLFVVLILPFITNRLIWLAGSEKINGTTSFIGKRFAGTGIDVYSVIWFVVGKDTIWFNGRNGILFKEGQEVPVRYQRKNPADARLNVFLSIWGDIVIYGGIPVLVLLVVFLHPEIIPYRSRIMLKTKKPFITIV